MANSLGIDFNPQPAYGSNPFEPIQQGINLGFGIQREQREQQKFQQDSEMEREKMKLLKFGQLADLYDKTKTESLRASYYNRTLRPFAKQGLGVDLPEHPDEPFNKIMSGVAEAYSQFKKGDLKEKEYGETLIDLHTQATIAKDKESASQIENLIKVGGRSDKDERYGRMDAGKLRIEFLNRPEIKEFVTIDTQVKSMDSLLSKALSGDMENKVALDQALVSMFNKLTDPASVVRESEFARTPENVPIVNRILGGVTKLQQGGAGLTNEDRKALVAGAKAIANERGAVLNDRRSEYESLAVDLGLDPSVVTRTIRPFVPYNIDGTRSSTVTFVDSDGVQHTIPKNNLDAARKRDPGLKVVK